ncbi:NAD-binding protein [Phellopilus nigrolimitatus]|nr:NAD-binding protein [Phellopilus nigrolimitatus]
MSHTTSALLSRSQSVVAVAGATGRLGQVITETFLTTFKPFFSRVIVFTRDPTSPKAQGLAALGAELAQFSFDQSSSESAGRLQESLKGVDIVANVLNQVDVRLKDMLAEAAVEVGAKVYFPSEFGVYVLFQTSTQISTFYVQAVELTETDHSDHRLNDFPGYDHEEWVKKSKHVSYVRELATRKGCDMKVISVYTGLFLEDSLHSRFGNDLETRTITTYGSSSTRVTYTSKEDIGRAVAQLAILAMLSPAALSDSVPDYVRISGSPRSAVEVAAAFEHEGKRGDSEKSRVEIVEKDLRKEKERLKDECTAGRVGWPAEHIRILMGEGKLDFSSDNSNELVNPRERLWKWKTVEDVALAGV